MTDAPAKRRFDPLRVVAALLALFVVGAVIIVAVARGPAQGTPPPVTTSAPPSSTAPASAPPSDADAEAAHKLEAKNAKTAKGKLMKSELQKRLDRHAEPHRETHVAAAGTTDVVITGDPQLKRAIMKRLTNVHITNESSHGFALSLKSETGRNSGGGVFARCSAAVSELPHNKLLAALTSKADAGGDGSNEDELKKDAENACAESLADDVSAFVRNHR